jgi:hypothetical protein
MLSSAVLQSLEALDSDWRLIPCDDRKRPIDPATGIVRNEWASHATDVDGIFEIAASPHVHAIGLVLGPESGVMAVDFDGTGSTVTFKEIYNRPYSDLPKTVSWSSGRPNRRQLAFRVPLDYWPHLRNRRTWSRNGSIVFELRWANHQSVIAGAHPDTAGYHWLPGRSPNDIAVADAPDWLLEPLLKRPSESPAAEYQPTEADGRNAVTLLEHITPREDYESWLAVGMALHSVNPGFLTNWVEWSRGCSNFNEEECLAKWTSFKKHGITIGTLYHYARQDGFIISQDDLEEFVWNPPEPEPEPEPAGDQQPSDGAESQATDEPLQEELEHARERLQQQLRNLQADIDLRAIFPQLLAEALISKADSMEMHPSALLGPVLTAACSIIGTRSRIIVNKGWEEPFVIWAGNILPPSAMKSPILNVVGNVLMKFQLKDLQLYKQEFRDAKQDPELNHEDLPPPRRWLVQDATYERIAQMVAEPRTIGLLSMQDELIGWFERLDARQSAGARAGWLSLWSGSAAMVDRKVAASSIAPSSAVSLMGNVQPDRLISMITTTEDDTAAAGDGLWARFLWCRPPTRPWKYNANGVNISGTLQQLFTALDGVPSPLVNDLGDNGSTIGLEVRIPPEVTTTIAAPQWEQWAIEASTASNPARAAFLGKLRGYSVRIAGLLFLLEIAEAATQSQQRLSAFCSSDPLTSTWYVNLPAACMVSALTLSEFYLQQFDAVQVEMGSGELSAQMARFLRLVAESGKTIVSPRDVITWRVFGRTKANTMDALRFLRQVVEIYGHGAMVPGRRKGQMVWQAENGGLADDL